MQLIPKTLISNFGGAHFRNARSVMFHPQESETLEALAKVMASGYVSYLSTPRLIENNYVFLNSYRLDAFTLPGWEMLRPVK